MVPDGPWAWRLASSVWRLGMAAACGRVNSLKQFPYNSVMRKMKKTDEFQIDFDLDNPKFDLKPPATEDEIEILEKKLACALPPSFKWWLRLHAESVFDIGNLLSIHPIQCHEKSLSVFSTTKSYRENEECHLKNLIVFGMTGVDFETFAFYTGVQNSAGEYPIVWITPGSIDDDAFVLCNTRFDRFLNIQVKMLLKSDEDADEGEYQKSFQELCRRYEPSIQIETDDFYELVVNAEQLRKQAERLFSTTHR